LTGQAVHHSYPAMDVSGRRHRRELDLLGSILDSKLAARNRVAAVLVGSLVSVSIMALTKRGKNL